MKKLLIIMYVLLTNFIFADFNEKLEREKSKKEKYLEQEKFEKESNKRNETYESLNFKEIKKENSNEVKFYISKINLSDDEKLLNEIEKERILKKYKNKELGSTDLANLLAELTNKLIAKGYITSVASIEKNTDLSTGTLDLKIIYGRIEKIILNDDTNLDRLKKFFLVDSKEGKILNLRNLDTTTDNFNYLEANNMSMEIKPSAKEQYSVLELKNKMKDKFTISLFTNNYGEDKQNGIWRYGSSVNIDSPLGIGDRLFFSYTSVHKKKPDRSWKNSSDIVVPGEILEIGPVGYDPNKGDVLPYKRILDIYNFQYTIKFRDYSLQLGKSRSERESSFYAFNTIYDLKSISDTTSLNLNKILWRNQKSKLILGTGIKKKHNKNYLENAVLYDRVLTIGDISLSGSTIFWGGFLNTSIGYERGLRALGAENDKYKIATSPKAEFNKYTLNSSFYKPINKFIYRFNLSAIHSNDVLYGSEKYSIGGIGSVGGYHRTGSIQGDRAIEIENEFSYKIYENEKFGTLTPYLAHSYGIVRNNENNTKYGKGHISGIQLGLRYNVKYFNFDIAYARALNYSSYLEPKNREIYFSAGMKIKF